MTGPLRISPETAVKLSKQLGVPLEHLMHMPRHILLQRMAELAAREAAEASSGSEVEPEAPGSAEAGSEPRKDGQA